MLLFGDGGRLRASLGVPDYGPSLVFQDNKGTMRAALAVSEAGPSQVLRGREGHPA